MARDGGGMGNSGRTLPPQARPGPRPDLTNPFGTHLFVDHLLDLPTNRSDIRGESVISARRAIDIHMWVPCARRGRNSVAIRSMVTVGSWVAEVLGILEMSVEHIVLDHEKSQ